MKAQLLELFPQTSWFLQAAQNKGFRIIENPQFLQNKFLNRFAIPGPNQIQNLIVPILPHTKNGSFDEVLIDYSQKWIREHKNALQTAYGKSPFYEYYDYRIYQIYDEHINNLKTFNFELFENLKKWVGLNNLPVHFVDNESIEVFDTHNNNIKIPEYNQVFHEKFGFRPQVSILDLLFNQGPLAKEYFENAI